MNYEDLPDFVKSSPPGYSVTYNESPMVYHRVSTYNDEFLVETVTAGTPFDSPGAARYVQTRIQRPNPHEPEIKPMSNEEYLEYLKRQYVESVESGDVSDMRESALELADFICGTERS